MNLLQLLHKIGGLYGRRNRLFLPTLMDRLGYLALSVGDLQNVIRKTPQNHQRIIIALGRCFSRVAAVHEYFNGELPFIDMLTRKFPQNHCAYCGKLPCQCLAAERPPYTLAITVDEGMVEWTLQQWCRHFDSLYGVSNKQIGIHAVVDRLNAEITEFLALAMQLPNERQRSIERILQEFALELSDIFAWICAVANFYGVEFESRVITRYCSACKRCSSSPCACRHFDFHPKQWEEEEV